MKTDHCALCYLHKMKDSNCKLTRWAIALSPFSLKIVHTPGKENVVADHLSRYNVPMDQENDDEYLDISAATADTHECLALYADTYSTTIEVPCMATSLERSLLEREHTLDWQEVEQLMQDDDLKFAHMISILKKCKDGCVIKGYTLRNGLLYKAIFCDESDEQKYVIRIGNRQLRSQLIELIHGNGHCGIDQTWLLLSRRVYWPKQYKDVTTYIKTCDRCQRAKVDKYNDRVVQQLTDIPKAPFVGWALDFAEISKENQKKTAKCFISAVDLFSRLCVVRSVASPTADLVIKFLKTDIIYKYGWPKVLRSDNGAAFTSNTTELESS